MTIHIRHSRGSENDEKRAAVAGSLLKAKRPLTSKGLRHDLIPLVPERPDDAVGETQAFWRVTRFRHINAVVEVLDAVVKLK